MLPLIITTSCAIYYLAAFFVGRRVARVLIGWWAYREEAYEADASVVFWSALCGHVIAVAIWPVLLVIAVITKICQGIANGLLSPGRLRGQIFIEYKPEDRKALTDYQDRQARQRARSASSGWG